MRNIQIAVDGPAGAGKSTIAKLIAKKLGFTYIDTGAMYRAITLKALRLHINLENEDEFSFVKHTTFSFQDGLLFMDGEDVSGEIRKHKVSNNVSLVSSYLSVRQECVRLQQSIANEHSVVMDGRDIGYKVLPNANIKFYLTASIDKRAERRYQEFVEKGIDSDLDILKQKIAERDHFDSTRQHSPLRPADDAILIDTSDLTIEQVVELMTNKIKEVE